MMKKLLLCLVALIAVTLGMSAKIGEPIVMPEFHDPELIPAKFTANNSVSMVFRVWDYDEDGYEYVSGAEIYSKYMELTKTINLPVYPAVTCKLLHQNKVEDESGNVVWSEPYEEVWSEKPETDGMDYYNENTDSSYTLYFTQHLFNHDDLFEWIVPTLEAVPCSWEDNWVKLSGEEIRCTGFKIMNENEEIVSTVDFPSGYSIGDNRMYPDLYDFGDVYYLTINVYNGEGYNATLVYRIDPETNSVKAVSEPIRTKVSPTAPKAGTPVRVELGGAAGQNARVSLIGESGQTVWSKALQPGATTTAIETSHLKKGVYVVVVSDGKSSHESTKIIVR